MPSYTTPSAGPYVTDLVRGVTCLGMFRGATCKSCVVPLLIRFYVKTQSEVIAAVKTTLALDRDDPSKPTAITALRKQTNDWVAKYRRDASFAGRPSYG